MVVLRGTGRIHFYSKQTISSLGELFYDAVKLAQIALDNTGATQPRNNDKNLVVKLNALELVSPCPFLSICLDVLTVT